MGLLLQLILLELNYVSPSPNNCTHLHLKNIALAWSKTKTAEGNNVHRIINTCPSKSYSEVQSFLLGGGEGVGGGSGLVCALKMRVMSLLILVGTQSGSACFSEFRCSKAEMITDVHCSFRDLGPATYQHTRYSYMHKWLNSQLR